MIILITNYDDYEIINQEDPGHYVTIILLLPIPRSIFRFAIPRRLWHVCFVIGPVLMKSKHTKACTKCAWAGSVTTRPLDVRSMLEDNNSSSTMLAAETEAIPAAAAEATFFKMDSRPFLADVFFPLISLVLLFWNCVNVWNDFSYSSAKRTSLEHSSLSVSKSLIICLAWP